MKACRKLVSSKSDLCELYGQFSIKQLLE